MARWCRRARAISWARPSRKARLLSAPRQRIATGQGAVGVVCLTDARHQHRHRRERAKPHHRVPDVDERARIGDACENLHWAPLTTAIARAHRRPARQATRPTGPQRRHGARLVDLDGQAQFPGGLLLWAVERDESGDARFAIEPQGRPQVGQVE